MTKNPATEPGNSTDTPAWKFKNFRNTTTCPYTGDKYEWCKLHEMKNEKRVHKGMYMPHPHNHEEWAACRAKYNSFWKEKQKDNKNCKSEADDANPPNK